MIESISQTQTKIPPRRSSGTSAQVEARDADATSQSKDAVEISDKASRLSKTETAQDTSETIPPTEEPETQALADGYRPEDFTSLPSTEKNEDAEALRLKPLPSTNVDITA